ncbi:MAG: hypothetical protein JXR86_08440 [Spirochaetales bacterium]|nr:hypothetical protein [Spirochaetales bacterium]
MVRRKGMVQVLLIMIFIVPGIFAQDRYVEVPGGFHDFLFGDSLEIVKEKLKYDSHFAYRGDPDVSMMLEPDRSIIDTAGSGFIERAYFLFDEEKLYQISLIINRDKIDFYTFQMQLSEKYGNPDSLDPTGMIWENENYRLSLEYPLTVKYVDLTVFDSFLEESQKRKSNGEVLREDFLDTF